MKKKEISKLSGQSLDVKQSHIDSLKSIFPQAVKDGKVDFKALQLILGDDIASDNERYGLNWAGKMDCFRHIQEPTTATLKPVKEESVDFDNTENIFIEGDNLQVLKTLQKSYHGKIKMIYIDPPYNTGKDTFIYPDRFQESKEEYLQRIGDKDVEGNLIKDGYWRKNSKDAGHFHSNWLSMMYPRLFLAKNLLRDDGVIFVSIDDNEANNLKMIMNEIFGEENHIATLSIINNMKGRNDKANVATCHEYLLLYSKGKFESYGLPLSEDQLKMYKNIDENGEEYALRDLRKRGRPDRREDRPNMFFPIYYNENKQTCTLERISKEDVEILPKRGDGSDGRWRWGFNRVSNNLKYLHPRYSTAKERWNVDHRVYLRPEIMSDIGREETDDGDQDFIRTTKAKSFWWGGDISTDVANREFKKLFPDINPDYPKSPFFMDKILHMSTKPNSQDIVMDFFSGYSTTAQAVLQLNTEDVGNRTFICVQLPEPCEEKSEAYEAGYKTIADIGKERIRLAANKIKEDNKGKLDFDGGKLDLGFKAFKLDESNFKPWRSDTKTAKELEKQLSLFVDNVKPETLQENILYELILKTGLDLNVKVEDKKTNGKKYFVIEDGKLAICLEEKISKALIEKITKLKPEKFICLDRAFAGNDQLKTNTALQMESEKIEFKVL